MKNLFIILFITTSVVLLNACHNEEKKHGITNLTAVNFQKMIQDNSSISLVDVRTVEEFAEGHLKNAVNIDFYDSLFEKNISVLDKSKPALVYCQAGKRSNSAVNLMQTLGFKELYNLEGGIVKWKAAGFAVIL